MKRIQHEGKNGEVSEITVMRNCGIKVWVHSQGVLRDGCFLRQMVQMRPVKRMVKRTAWKNPTGEVG